MLQLDEYNQLLVTNPFADDSSAVSSSSNHDIFVALALDSLPDHPLRSRSVSPEHCWGSQSKPAATVVGTSGEARPKSTPLLSLDGSSVEVVAEEDRITGSASGPPRGSNPIIHPVGPNDSFAGVALRYGVSIAALRRANKLWPSDPIHLRTELLIPRGDTRRSRHKPTRSPSTNTALRSTVGPTPDLPDLFTSSFVAARNMILSALPARISLDSLSSKASASEDHELDDLQTARSHKMSAVEAPFVQDGHELSVLAAPRVQYKLPGVPLSSHTNSHHPIPNHISPVGHLGSRTISSSSTVPLRRHRSQPFAVLPVRTSQLEPEPAMELPVRRSRI